MVYVGKNRGFHTRTQPEIHELLCQFAEKGSRVLRLKGGDPFVFGRGGEEMEYLQERGIKVYTVPGQEVLMLILPLDCVRHASQSILAVCLYRNICHIRQLPFCGHMQYYWLLNKLYFKKPSPLCLLTPPAAKFAAYLA